MNTLKMLLLALGMALLAGCSSMSFTEQDTSGKLFVQVGTLKLIERDNDIGVVEVQAAIDRMRDRMDDTDVEVPFIDLKDLLLSEINLGEMMPSDRLLIMAFVDAVTPNLDIETGIDTDWTNEEQRVRIRQVLDWAEQALVMAE